MSIPFFPKKIGDPDLHALTELPEGNLDYLQGFASTHSKLTRAACYCSAFLQIRLGLKNALLCEFWLPCAEWKVAFIYTATPFRCPEQRVGLIGQKP